jgi:hypothetical protein
MMAQSAIRLLEENDLALKIATQAREECRRYSWAAVRNEWLSVYQELASEKVLSPVKPVICDGVPTKE